MNCLRERDGRSCLFIPDEVFSPWGRVGRPATFDLPGIDVRVFRRGDDRGLWEQLQIALQSVRAQRGACAVVGMGAGCAAALALACQLSVEKLVLVEPSTPARASRTRDVQGNGEAARLRRLQRRLTAFARRNLPLCVSDMLVVERDRVDGTDALRRAFGNPVNCRVNRLIVAGECADQMFTIREFAVKEAISRFLHPQDASKPLAENPEMCIIYG